MTSEKGVGRVVRDVIDLCELQIQLLSLDGQVASGKMVRAAVLIAAGVSILGSGLTVFLLGLGWVLHESLKWSIGFSLLGIAMAAITIGITLAIIAYYCVKGALSALSETKSEFSENLKWMKAVILRPETSPRNQIRRESFAADNGRSNAATSDSDPSRF